MQKEEVICTTEDDYVKERFEDQPRWVARLSNGLTVYQDDYRPNLTEYSAWRRLRQYCKSNSVQISELKLQFRSHVEDVPKGDGYYFARGAGAWFGKPTDHFFVVGFVKNDIIYKTWWRIPELLKDREQEIPLTDLPWDDERLIL